MEVPKQLQVVYAIVKLAGYVINAIWILTTLVNNVILALNASTSDNPTEQTQGDNTSAVHHRRFGR